MHFEKIIGVPLPLLIYKMWNLIRNLNLDGCIFCRLWTRYATP